MGPVVPVVEAFRVSGDPGGYEVRDGSGTEEAVSRNMHRTTVYHLTVIPQSSHRVSDGVLGVLSRGCVYGHDETR